MLNKTFIITEFGNPFSWTQKYIDHVQFLKKDGWNWKIFTPNTYNVPEGGNVEVVPMTATQFAVLVEEKLGVKPQMFITQKGVPSVHITDFYVFTGLIFEDYLKDVDYWGITNMDIVYGNLSKFLPDSELRGYDVWTDDVGPEGGRVNGIFSLWRNTERINKICLRVPNWRAKLSALPCPKCLGEEEQHHHLFGTDEIDMVPIMQQLASSRTISYGYPPYYPYHSYDRLRQHLPEPRLSIKPDGSLYELFPDSLHPNGVGMFDGMTGKEIMYFHFIRTKEWPIKEQ